MNRDFNVFIEQDRAGYYVATVPSLKGCHTQARSLDKLMERVREAIELCLVHSGETLGPGLLAQILRDCELSPEDLRSLL